jgi:hypothetical protein
MGTSQAYAPKIQPMGGTPHVFLTVRREGLRRIGSRVSRLLNSVRTAAAPSKCKEWAAPVVR